MPPTTRRKPGPLSYHRKLGHELDPITHSGDDDEVDVEEDSTCVICLDRARCYDLIEDTDDEESDLFESLEVFLETQLSDAIKRAFQVCRTCKDIIEELHQVRLLIEHYLLNMKSIQLKLSASVVESEHFWRSDVRRRKWRGMYEVPRQCQSFRMEILNRFNASVSIPNHERVLADKRLAQRRSEAIRKKPSILSELMPKFSSSLLFGTRKRKPAEAVTKSPKKSAFADPTASNISLSHVTGTPAFVSPVPGTTYGSNNNMTTEVVFQCTPDGTPSFIIRKNEFGKGEFPAPTETNQQYLIPQPMQQPSLPVQPGYQGPANQVGRNPLENPHFPTATITGRLSQGHSVMYQPFPTATVTTTSCTNSPMPSSSPYTNIRTPTFTEVLANPESVQIIPSAAGSHPSASEGITAGVSSNAVILDIMEQNPNNEMCLFKGVDDSDHFNERDPVDNEIEGNSDGIQYVADDIVKTEWAADEGKADDVVSVVSCGSESDFPENEQDSDDPEWKSSKPTGKMKSVKQEKKSKKASKDKSNHIIMDNGLKKWKHVANIYEVEPNKWCFRDKLFYCFRPDLDDWCCLYCNQFTSETQSHLHEHMKGHYKNCSKYNSFDRRPRQKYHRIKVPGGFTYGGYMVHVDTEGNHQCSACPKNIKLPYEMTKHIMRDHIRGSELDCSECGKQFAYPSLLELHLEEGHNIKIKEERRYMCQHCGKVYKSPKTLENHERSVHPAYPCTLCRRISSTQERRDNHMLKCHGVAPDGTLVPVLAPGGPSTGLAKEEVPNTVDNFEEVQ